MFQQTIMRKIVLFLFRIVASIISSVLKRLHILIIFLLLPYGLRILHTFIDIYQDSVHIFTHHELFNKLLSRKRRYIEETSLYTENVVIKILIQLSGEKIQVYGITYIYFE